VIIEPLDSSVRARLIQENFQRATHLVASNIGAKVKKGDIERSTTSLHCWNAVEDKLAMHGDVEVGTLKESYGDDISLVGTTQPFSNKLLDIDTKVQQFIHSDLLKFGHFFVMDKSPGVRRVFVELHSYWRVGTQLMKLFFQMVWSWNSCTIQTI